MFNQNMWLLPFPFSKHNKKRLQFLIEFIRLKKPDVVTLQELTQTKFIRMLEKSLNNYYFTYIAGNRFNRSGLLTLSKIKPLRTLFYPFSKSKNMSRLDKLSNRGIQKLDFDNICIYNTHLYHKALDEKLKIMLEEFKIVKSKIDNKKICFLCGDLNLTKEQFENANKGFFEYVENSDNTFSNDNRYLKKWWDRKVTGDKKIDYILVRNPTKKKISYKSETIKEGLSDHYGIYSIIEIS